MKKTSQTTKAAPKSDTKKSPKKGKRLTVDAVVKAGETCTFGNKTGCGT